MAVASTSRRLWRGPDATSCHGGGGNSSVRPRSTELPLRCGHQGRPGSMLRWLRARASVVGGPDRMSSRARFLIRLIGGALTAASLLLLPAGVVALTAAAAGLVLVIYGQFGRLSGSDT